jgi:hypothetical protein
MRLFACATPSRSISRPQWLHANFQRRFFHLLGATFPGDVHPLDPSRREILDFSLADFYKKPSKIHLHLRLYNEAKRREMSLETALSKFAKPGKLLLPIPQPKTHKAGEVLQHHFKPIDIKSVRHHISPNQERTHEYHFFPSRDDTSLYENCMVEIWLLLLKGMRVEIQVHTNGPKDNDRFKRMLNRNIHLRPDVILAAMPPPSRIIIDPYTNHEKVCWVMEGPFAHPRTHEKVKPLNKTGEFYKRRLEVMRAVMEAQGGETQAGEQEQPGLPSELEFDDIWNKENGNIPSEPEDDGGQRQEQGIEQEQVDIPPELDGQGWERKEGADTLPESTENAPHSPALSILSPEEQELEDYKELEEITGFR